jgi:hypothetical protein
LTDPDGRELAVADALVHGRKRELEELRDFLSREQLAVIAGG